MVEVWQSGKKRDVLIIYLSKKAKDVLEMLQELLAGRSIDSNASIEPST